MSTHSTKQSWRWLMGAASALQVAWSGWAGAGSMAIALVVVTSTTAEAGQLTQWRYNESAHQVELTLSEETTPRYFLLAQPARIVVDLPNTQVGAVPLEQSLSGPVRSVRINQFQPDVARIVIELSSDAVLGDGQVAIQRVNASDLSVRPLFAGELSDPAPTAIAPLPAEPPASIAAEEPLSPAAASPVTVSPVNSAEEAAPDTSSADTLPPLEPGAIELTVTPPAPASEGQNAEPEPEFAVPSLNTALAELGVTGANMNPLREGAIAQDAEPNSDISSSVSVAEVTEAPIEHQFDPNAPVLDATVPTEQDPAVLDATRPSSVMLMPPQSSVTSPQDALAQVRETVPEAAVEIPVELPAAPAESSASTPTDSPVEAEVPTVSPPEPEVAIARPAEMPVEEVEVERSPAPAPRSAPPSVGEVQRSAIAFGQPIAETADTSTVLQSGMTISLRYPGDAPLSLDPGIRQEVLLLQQPIQDQQGNVIVEAGSPVIGRFETSDTGSKFVIQAIAAQSQNIRVTGESALISQQDASISTSENASDSTSSTFNPAAVFGGAATSAAAQIQPDQIVILPDQIITVQITDDLALR